MSLSLFGLDMYLRLPPNRFRDLVRLRDWLKRLGVTFRVTFRCTFLALLPFLALLGSPMDGYVTRLGVTFRVTFRCTFLALLLALLHT